jgi:hypothetical protein
MGMLEEAGVDVVPRPGTLVYMAENGGPGRMVLDPEASIGAFHHEVRHFTDIQAEGFRRLKYYGENPGEFWRIEYRGYMEEIRIARQMRDFDVGRAIAEQMRARRMELMGK